MEDHVEALRDTQRPIYEALASEGPMTDEQLQEFLGLPANKMCPRRLDLVKLGLVEQIGMAPTRSGNQAKQWAVVPSERVAEAREQAANRKERRKTVEGLPLDKQVAIVITLLKLDSVNAALLDLEGRAGSRARGRARGSQRHAEAERRELKEKIKEAEAEQSALLHFLKALRNLKSSEGVVRSVRDFVRDDADRRRTYGVPLIPDGQLDQVRTGLSDLIDLAEDARATLDSTMGLEDNVIESDAVDITDLDLPAGEPVG